MATDNLSLRAQADSIRSDITSILSCSAATVATLQQLLSPIAPKKDAQKENAKPKVARAITVASTTRTKTASRTTVRSRTTVAVEVTENAPAALSTKDRYILATDVINATLKILSEYLKTQPSKPSHPPSSRKPQRPGASNGSAPNCESSQNAPRPLKERSASQATNSPKKPSSLRRTSSYASYNSCGLDAGLITIVECARIAFAHLRSLEASKIGSETAPGLQLENGILAFIGKLISLGLHNVALKELRILKRRLEVSPSSQQEKSGRVLKTQSGARKTGTIEEKETIASLLCFDQVDYDSPALPLIISVQTYALRIIGLLGRPHDVEAALEFLDPARPTSPVNLILRSSKPASNQAKAARQLESVSQTILSLCPSISSSEDASACDLASKPSPETAFRLQHLAFRIRQHWWKLSGHQANINKELLEPFAKCLTAFSRRATCPSKSRYSLAKSAFTDLSESAGFKSQHDSRSNTLTSIHRTLSSLANAASLTDDALHWAANPDHHDASKDSAATTTARLVRIASLSLEAVQQKTSGTGCENAVREALNALGGNLSGSLAELDDLFTEANGLRKAASKYLIAQEAHIRCPNHGLYKSAFGTLSASVHFVARYIGTKPCENGNDTSVRHAHRIAMGMKVIRGLVESVLTCGKQAIDIETVDWEALDALLRECVSTLSALESPSDDSKTASKLHRELQFPLVKLSNIYWLYFLQSRKHDRSSQTQIRAMQRSVELLLHRSIEERQAGVLPMKLEKLADALDAAKNSAEAQNCYSQAIGLHIEFGTLRDATIIACQTVLQRIFEYDGSINVLGRLLKSCHRSFVKNGIKIDRDFGFFDDVELTSAERGLLLEWQLSLFCKTVAKNRQWDTAFDLSVRELAERLLSIYSECEYPIRRKRVFVKLFQIANENADILPVELLQLNVSFLDAPSGESSSDGGLHKYQHHLRETLKITLALRESHPNSTAITESTRIWQQLVTTASSWTSVLEQIDDPSHWLSQLQLLVDYLDAKGEEYLSISVSKLLASALELRQSSDSSDLVSSLSKLGLQLLRLGYSGKAGISFAKAQNLLSQARISTEAKLQWHLGYAEYQLSIGNPEKCSAILSSAEEFAVGDLDFMSLTKPSTTLSGRMRFNRLLADALYVYGMLALENGCPKDAMRYAKRCVTLNRRIWSALENKSSVIQSSPPTGNETGIDALTEGVSNLMSSVNARKDAPVILSITHDALDGAAFWSLVPCLYRSLTQQAHIHAHQGMLQEAIYFAEQAEKVAQAVGSRSLMIDNVSQRAEYWAQSGRPDKGQLLYDSVTKPSEQSLSSVRYFSSLASIHHANGDLAEEAKAHDRAESLLDELTKITFMGLTDHSDPAEDHLAKAMSSMSLGASKPPVSKTTKTVRGRKPAAKAAPKSKREGPTESQSNRVRSSEECSILSSMRADVLTRKAVMMLVKEKLSAAAEFLQAAHSLQQDTESIVMHRWTGFKHLVAQSMKDIAADFTFNSLPESTIAFPVLARSDRKLSENAGLKPSPLSLVGKEALGEPVLVKSGRGKKVAKESFTSVLQRARDYIADIHSTTLRSGSTSSIYRTSRALNDITILLSAATGGGVKGAVHPLYASYMTELPKHYALQLEQANIEVEKEQLSRDDLLEWPQLGSHEKCVQPCASNFQRDYIDIIPDSWAAVSLSLNDDLNELYVTRYQSGQSPFTLRLPMARHTCRDMDGEEFSFEDGRRDFEEIIELSNFSTHDAKDMTTKGARTEWWDGREALDSRLRDLLVNIENIWLGGFRGIFSQHTRQPAVLARFQKSFQDVLDRHLPSRQGRGQQKKLNLEPRVLELFIGLGDANDGELDLDEPLMDLVYFVVDVLQFNGERNAYDEIDFDAIVIDTLDALRAYHSSASQEPTKSAHTILILDKNLHAFPWESLPSLQSLSISRLPSLAALRARLLAVRTSTQENGLPGHSISTSAGGTSYLNPSGDLTHTQKTLKPQLDAMEGKWNHIIARAPTEKEFETALGKEELVLYFGHGSGAQYVRSRSVKKLYAGEQLQEDHARPSCATTLLFGCSSAHLSENGIYEPSGTLSSYLTAGAPAVLGMLWDVTDKDCDRFAVRMGEVWGLWPESQRDSSNTSTTKSKGKSKVAQRVAEVESARGAGMGRRGRKADIAASESEAEASRSRERRRGVGLDEAVRDARDACVLRYLNGAAAVVYGIPVYLD